MPRDNVTHLLAQMRDGKEDAANQPIRLLFAELRRMAGAASTTVSDRLDGATRRPVADS